MYLKLFKASKKHIPLESLVSLWPFQQFGDKTEHFCGICIVLEVEPLACKVFAGHWTWKSSIRKVCYHFVSIWGSTLPFGQHLQHFGVRTFHWLL